MIEGGPAEKGGLLPDDIVITIDDTAIIDFAGLIGYLASQTRPGDIVTLDLIRDGDNVQIDVALGERPGS